MSSVNIDGQDYKRCMKCGEWTNYNDLMYIPPTAQYNREEDDRLHAALSTEIDERGYNVVVDDEAYAEYAAYNTACFGLDVCAACALLNETAYRAPTVTITL